ncbi:ExbD/TolR family protein [Ketobacter alkanivorans]|uniref:Biopolymer transporter ExbD n=1 Tax=Ketobacter alkanivorans TaxID=1917421 RepID=A0A2K9LJP8_9GAMM|nr:biopolymer transporter ExbD [Ketobacter alkanivorans]AUM12483.1 hypothetical protein Kalk_08640 [Ketobacter alkanivorans]
MVTAALGYKPRRRSIGLTALIDVVFILLMFFMLTSNFDQWGAVEFHPMVAAEPNAESKNQLVFLNEDLSLDVKDQGNRKVGSLDHYQQLGAAQMGWFNADAPIILVPEATVSVQDIVSALDSLRALGISSVNYGGAKAP